MWHVSLTRVVLLLVGVLAVMLAAVVLRAETIRLNNRVARLEQQSDALRQELHEKELELARLRNPSAIRERVLDLRLRGVEGGAAKP